MPAIDAHHPDYTETEQRRVICRDLMGGTERMREKSTEYLPKEAAEAQTDYEVRLNRTWLFNGFKRTVLDLSGRVFDRPVTVSGHDSFKEWSDNITLDGRDLTVFARDLFHTGLTEGLAFVLVDYPHTPRAENRAEERALKARPYFVEIKPEALIWWNVEINSGVPVLTMIRFIETYIDPEKGERKRQIREWQRGGQWYVYREVTGEGGKSGWAVVEDGVAAPVKSIPLVAIYFGERKGYFKAEPPLRDLAEMNVCHWQSYSDQRHVLHIARVPVLFTKMLGGEGPNQKIVVGVNQHLRAQNPAADAKYIEHTGAAIGAGRDDVLDIESRMESMGVQLLLANKPGNMTATGKAIDKATEESTLQIMAKTIQDGLQQAFRLAAEWMGLKVEPEVDMNTTFDLILADSSELQVLQADRERGDLSQESYWREMVRRGIYREDFDPEQERIRLAGEGPSSPFPRAVNDEE